MKPWNPGAGGGPGRGAGRRLGPLGWLGQILLWLSLVVFVPLIVIEIGFRIFAPQPTAVNVSEWDSELGWRNRPGARGFFHTREFRMEVRINSLGLRDRETTFEKPAGTWRLLGLGDSFLFGHGVAEDSCFLSIVERDLEAKSRAAGGPAIEALNTGVGKWGTAAEYLYFKKDGVRLHPDVVLLAFCVDNDFDNNADGNLLRREGDHLVRVPSPEPGVRKAQRITRLIPGYDFLAEHSQLLNFIRIHASVLDMRRAAAQARQAAVSDSVPARGPEWEEHRLAVTTMLMDSLLASTRAAGHPLAVLVIPSQWQTVPESRWGGRLFQDPRPAAALAERLIAHLDSLGVPTIYPVVPLTEAGRARRLYFEEGHLNEAGNRVVAGVLVDSLTAAGLVPASLR